jgi:hypothetical protein
MYVKEPFQQGIPYVQLPEIDGPYSLYVYMDP